MRVLLGCPTAPQPGAAALARSVAIAEALVERGHGALLCADISEDWARDMSTEAGLDVRDWPDTAEGLLHLLRDEAVDLVHVDGPVDGLTSLPDNGFRISRLGSDSPVPVGADLVITPSVAAPSGGEGGAPADGPLTVTGPAYAPLRSSVRDARERRQWRAGGMGDRLRVLVRLGDEESADRMLEVVRSLANSDVSADVLVVAPSTSTRMAAEGLSTRTVRVLGTARRADLPRLVADHDLVVTRPGPILWELCCIGSPVALMGLTEDDDRLAAPWVEADLAVSLGRLGAGARPAGQLRALLRDGLRRAQLGSNGLRLVDGGGAGRVATLMEGLVTTG
jgi:hypothetical protein